jgi:hypothetical protein
MPVPIAAISAGLGVASKLFGRRKRPDISRAIAELRASRPVGYITPEDLRSAELTRGRLTEGVQAQGRLGGYEIGRRFRARGLAGSPSEERSRARLEQETLLGGQHAGETAEEQLYNIRTGREAYQRQQDLAIFGAQVGQSQRESERQQAEDSAFWNSLNEFVPTIQSAIGAKGGATDYSGWTLGEDGKYHPPQYGPKPGEGGFVPETEPSIPRKLF